MWLVMKEVAELMVSASWSSPSHTIASMKRDINSLELYFADVLYAYRETIKKGATRGDEGRRAHFGKVGEHKGRVAHEEFATEGIANLLLRTIQ